MRSKRVLAGARFTVRSIVVAAVSVTLACTDSTSPAPGVSLSFDSSPASTVAGAAMSPAIQVSILDASGHVATNATDRVTLALDTKPAAGILSGVTTVAAVSGIATFSAIRIDKSAVGYTFSASSPGLTQAVSTPFNVVAGGAVKLAFISQPANTIARTVIPSFSIAIQDAFGNTVATDGVTIGVELASGRPGAQIIGVATATTVQGVATFSQLSIDTPGIAYALRAVSATVGIAGETSGPFNIVVGPASRLEFFAQPTTIGPGEVLAPSVSVRVTDVGGNVLTDAATGITISIASNPGGATLSGTRALPAVNGVATFGDLSLDKVGVGYVLTATATGLTAASSATFSVRVPLSFATIASGYFHSCASDANGNAYCWGVNDGQLGDGTNSSAPTAVSVDGGHKFVSLSTGRTHSCGLDDTSHAFCWGSNGSGELGTSPFGARNVPGAVFGPTLYSSISAGYAHTCAVATTGVAYCWGGNSAGELGSGDRTVTSAPTAVTGGIPFASVSAGRFFSCGVTPAHIGYCWGDNAAGELGSGTSTASTTQPLVVAGQLQFSSIGAGGFFSCGLTVDGAAYCWGQNGSGQLGAASNVAGTNAPVAVAGGLVFTSITVGNRHACGVTGAGVAYCWGDNTEGALGNGVIVNSSSPSAVVGGLSFASLSAGRFHTCGVTVTGAGYCWGQNGSGQLGSPSVTASRVPIRVR